MIVAIFVTIIAGIYFYSSLTTLTTDSITGLSDKTLPVVVSSKPLERGSSILHVSSEPSGADVYLDKRLLGQTPLQRVDLPTGDHEIILTHANTENQKEIISLSDNVKVKKKYVLKYTFGSVRVASTPEGAHIIIDGLDTRLTTPATLNELIGEHHIKLRKDGYYPKEATITILNGMSSVEEFILNGGHLQKHKGEWLEPEKKAEYVAKEEKALRLDRTRNRSEKSRIDKADKLRNLATQKSEVGDVGATKQLLGRAQWYAENSQLDEKIMARAQQQYDNVKNLLGQMVLIPEGEFQMGSIIGDRDEQPVHKVWIRSFYLGQYEVTQAQWLELMADNPSSFNGCSDCPVENVSWKDIQQFLEKLNKKTGRDFRLPTEAEWEYACRSGGKDELYCGGNRVYASAWYGENSSKRTHPVKKKSPNGLGLYDMSGNVWEWTDDCPNDTYKNSPNNGAASRKGDCTKRVIRGGSWLNSEWNMRSSDRSWFANSYRSYNLGFRLAQGQ